MKAIVTAAAALSLFAASAYAETAKAQIEDHYKEVTIKVPTTVMECSNVQVPIYGEERFDQGSAIIGGLVGGIIGSQVGKGNGNKVATGVGAMTGAIIGGKKEPGIVGYRQEERCKNVTTYEYRKETRYDYSTIKFRDNEGYPRTLTFTMKP